MAEIFMPEISDSWGKYGFPAPYLRTPYKTVVALAKAVNERAVAVRLPRFAIPDFFSWLTFNEDERLREVSASVGAKLGTLDSKIGSLTPYFVNPDKIPTAASRSDCFWTWYDLLLAGADGDADNIFSWTGPYSRYSYHSLWPVKWAIQRYNQINRLRYKFTQFLSEWPYVEYEDLNDTFYFKEEEQS